MPTAGLTDRTSEEAGQSEEAGRERGSERGSGTGPILLSQATFLLAHIANSGPVPLSFPRLASGCWPGSAGRDWLPAGFQ